MESADRRLTSSTSGAAILDRSSSWIYIRLSSTRLFPAMSTTDGNTLAPTPENEVPWWMKYAGRGVGTVGGIRKLLY